MTLLQQTRLLLRSREDVTIAATTTSFAMEQNHAGVVRNSGWETCVHTTRKLSLVLHPLPLPHDNAISAAPSTSYWHAMEQNHAGVVKRASLRLGAHMLKKWRWGAYFGAGAGGKRGRPLMTEEEQAVNEERAAKRRRVSFFDLGGQVLI